VHFLYVGSGRVIQNRGQRLEQVKSQEHDRRNMQPFFDFDGEFEGLQRDIEGRKIGKRDQRILRPFDENIVYAGLGAFRPFPHSFQDDEFKDENNQGPQGKEDEGCEVHPETIAEVALIEKFVHEFRFFRVNGAKSQQPAPAKKKGAKRRTHGEKSLRDGAVPRSSG
jgi:hypothetical protein